MTIPKLDFPVTVFSALKWATASLQQSGQQPTAAKELLQGLLGWNLTTLVANYRTQLSATQRDHFEEVVHQACQGQPVQYILGQAPFYGLELQVNPAVLIPRPETEELVDWLLHDYGTSRLRLLDLGTGSGAIALACKHERPNWQVLGSDISKAALQVARQNATALGLDVTWQESDLFQTLQGQRFEVIISNPPYIANCERTVMDQQVLDYEPSQALFASHHGLAFYQRIANEIATYLTRPGTLYLEIGYRQGVAVQRLLQQANPTAQIGLQQDLAGHDRMIKMKLR
ncbi:peptide chain release factor N(5)-glutamine methyltransferase [Fructilactobacillus florum]|uniref:Release factor glutamine methyltransferase n=1 Tax=Fructilactobacillus florum DSM 22689 = JCM 16035 TaxID=1423745 RepID=A0A0R2CN32_9LACO|nr:peptide chain release factor N(5)-glutamine methyltransferase [Fructilactobacillus florum]KRM92466.1 N5-glutamine S-adenosyl-L-methionine-dependent methyltransferase [Fructilactobacillus florum DSM 22689 = JCM 16035]